MKTRPTSLGVSPADSMKKTRLPPCASMKRPGAMAFTSSRCVNWLRSLYVSERAQGEITIESSAIMTTTGSAKRIMGSIHERSERPPEENQTTISLSCQERMSVISAAIKSEAARRGGRFTSAL